MHTPRAVILDVDGTLVDSNDAHARAWVDALAEIGLDVPFERVRRLIGMGGDKLLPLAVGLEKDDERGSRASERRGEIFKERYLAAVAPLPGARALVERFRDTGMTVTVASSAQPDELDSLLDCAGVRGLIETATSGGQQPSKPQPDTVEAVLARIGFRPEEALMLGDTPYDVEAAGRAGVRTVAVRSGGWDRPELDGAIAIYDDPADLLARFDESPFVRAGADGDLPPIGRGERDKQASMVRKAEDEATSAG